MTAGSPRERASRRVELLAEPGDEVRPDQRPQVFRGR